MSSAYHKASNYLFSSMTTKTEALQFIQLWATKSSCQAKNFVAPTLVKTTAPSSVV